MHPGLKAKAGQRTHHSTREPDQRDRIGVKTERLAKPLDGKRRVRIHASESRGVGAAAGGQQLLGAVELGHHSVHAYWRGPSHNSRNRRRISNAGMTGKPRAKVVMKAGDVAAMPADIRHKGYSPKRSMLIVWENNDATLPQRYASGELKPYPVEF